MRNLRMEQKRFKKKWTELQRELLANFEEYSKIHDTLQTTQSNISATNVPEGGVIAKFEAVIYHLKKVVDKFESQIHHSQKNWKHGDESLLIFIQSYKNEVNVKRKVVENLYQWRLIPSDVVRTYQIILETEPYL